MQDAGSSSKIWKWVVAAAVLLLLNYAWELAHSRLFTNYVNVARIHHALACLQHAFTDLLISSGTYLVTAVAFQRLAWAASTRWVWPTLLWLSLGMIVTVGIEIWATSIGRWNYTEAMPTLFGVGLTPILQWVVVPVAALFVFRKLLS